MGNSLFPPIIARNTSDHATDKRQPRYPLTQLENQSLFPVVTQHKLQGFFPILVPRFLHHDSTLGCQGFHLEKNFLGE